VTGTILLLKAMEKYGCKKLVFSSSAAVYGTPKVCPVTEEEELEETASPYGRTKLFAEHVMRDVAQAKKDWKIVMLRYFNPAGAHPSGLIGEDPKGVPNNLTPYVVQVAMGKLDKLRIFGGDYDTPDGTGVRDYVHIVDLAKGHLAALTYLDTMEHGCEVFNLGTGSGYSVLEIVKAMSRACGKEIPYEIVARRPGDVSILTADAGRANRLLRWHATRDLDDMCRDLWRWQCMNPHGYE